MAGLFCLAAALEDVRSSPLAPKGSRIKGFPKSVRILRSKDFRRVYEHGSRYSGPYFAAFYVRRPDSEKGSKLGFTVPRSLGGAVVRNRIKRRVREAVRLRLDRLSPEWEIVFNPRRAAMDSPFTELTREIEKLFLRCNSLC
jgi:ribonuclease P protein component